MCGRLILTASGPELAEAFGLDAVPSLAPRYNIAPTQDLGVVRLHADTRGRTLDLLRWGLIPSWAESPAVGSQMINARSETVATRAAFREAFKARRCLVPTTGFYEWQKRGKAKQPYLIRRRDRAPFGFAGLWEAWRDPAEPAAVLETCTILTTEANDVVAPVHLRMPVVLAPRDYERWLDPDGPSVAALKGLLRPAPAAELEAVPISDRVNSTANDDPDLLRPVEPERQAEQKSLF